MGTNMLYRNVHTKDPLFPIALVQFLVPAPGGMLTKKIGLLSSALDSVDIPLRPSDVG